MEREHEYGSLVWWSQTVDVKKLEELFKNFSQLFQLGIYLLSPDGESVFAVDAAEFCKHVRSIGKGKSVCEACDKQAMRVSLRRQDIHLYTCSNGLIDMCVPLHIGDKLVGFLASGQAQTQPPTQSHLKDVSRLWSFAQTQEEHDSLIEKYNRLPILEERTLKRAMETLRLLAVHIIELCEMHLTKQKLLKQELLLSQQESRRCGMERALRQAQLEALQRQINPHFLFNSLNCVARLALFENAKRTLDMAEQLAEYLRYTLENQNQHGLVYLKEELQCVRSYLEIHKVRFSDRLNFTLEEDLKAADRLAPFMLLQPLVENAMIHGLEPALEGGFLRLKTHAYEEFTSILLEDNGVGFDAASLQEGLGLKNVRKLLELYYEDKASLNIRSEPGNGARIELRIPIRPAHLPLEDGKGRGLRP